jgi:hypothetical protein
VHGRGACLAAVSAAFRQGCRQENDHVAPGSAARDRSQRAHFMDIGLFRARTPLGLPFDRPNPLEVSLPVVAVIVRADLPESLVLPLLGLLCFGGLPAKPVPPALGLAPTGAAVLRSIPILRPRHESVSTPFEKALPSTARFFGFGACLRIQSRVDEQCFWEASQTRGLLGGSRGLSRFPLFIWGDNLPE